MFWGKVLTKVFLHSDSVLFPSQLFYFSLPQNPPGPWNGRNFLFKVLQQWEVYPYLYYMSFDWHCTNTGPRGKMKHSYFSSWPLAYTIVVNGWRFDCYFQLEVLILIDHFCNRSSKLNLTFLPTTLWRELLNYWVFIYQAENPCSFRKYIF